MELLNGLQSSIINLDGKEFDQVALEVFQFQSKHNPVYKTYIRYLGVNSDNINHLDQVPFLPIELFKSNRVVSGNWQPAGVFSSSGTGGTGSSNHYINDFRYYEKISLDIFQRFYGSVEDYHIMALMPSYLERQGSSLVHMLNYFIQKSNSNHSNFYLRNYQQLTSKINSLVHSSERQIMLWGVSFALLDLAERGKINLADAIIIETGGMKGEREEIIREDLHNRLKDAFGCDQIQSEYGMAELTSQAYTVDGRFHTPPWMSVMIRDIHDPLDKMPAGKVGGINVIDLANIHSCAFIETQDLGEVDEQGTFQILGRIDNSDVRGCNLMVN